MQWDNHIPAWPARRLTSNRLSRDRSGGNWRSDGGPLGGDQSGGPDGVRGRDRRAGRR